MYIKMHLVFKQVEIIDCDCLITHDLKINLFNFTITKNGIQFIYNGEFYKFDNDQFEDYSYSVEGINHYD